MCRGETSPSVTVSAPSESSSRRVSDRCVLNPGASERQSEGDEDGTLNSSRIRPRRGNSRSDPRSYPGYFIGVSINAGHDARISRVALTARINDVTPSLLIAVKAERSSIMSRVYEREKEREKWEWEKLINRPAHDREGLLGADIRRNIFH